MAEDNAADMMLNFSNLKDAAVAGGAVINDAKQLLTTPDQGHVEIEGRLGRWTDEGFSSNIGNAAFCTILHLLETFPRWSHCTDWQETQDVFYSLPMPTTTGEVAKVQVRTSVCSKEGQHVINHIVKKRIRCADFTLQSMDQGSCALATDTGKLINDISARLTSSLEKTLPTSILPVAVSPEVVRIKQRKRFLLPSLGIENDCFAFDATIVYTGATKSDAERKQKNNEDPSFEIEVECLAPTAYLNMCANEGSCLALSLLAKLLDFASHLNHSVHVTFVPRGLNHVVPGGAAPSGPKGMGCITNTSGMSAIFM